LFTLVRGSEGAVVEDSALSCRDPGGVRCAASQPSGSLLLERYVAFGGVDRGDADEVEALLDGMAGVAVRVGFEAFNDGDAGRAGPRRRSGSASSQPG
jgi:hypothetical protein